MRNAEFSQSMVACQPVQGRDQRSQPEPVRSDIGTDRGYRTDPQTHRCHQAGGARSVSGYTNNANPPQSAGLFDATKTNWHLYWGGDLAGIQQKMSYLQGLGVTAIWISPPVDNLNLNIPDSNGNP